MNNFKILCAFLVSLTLLIGCGPKDQVDQSVTNGDTETNTAEVEEETAEVELIPVDVWAIIDVNEAGQVTSAEFVEYYIAKAEDGDKLSESEAQQKFSSLDQDSDGQLTKQEATGQN